MNVDASTAAAALTEALSRHRGGMVGFVARRLGGDRAEAEEVVARTAARAWEHRTTLREPERIRAWLFAVARSTLRDYLRAKAVRDRFTPSVDVLPECAPETNASRCDCSLALLASLPASYAGILRLVEVEGHTLAEAAQRLDITVNNATVRLSRARARLRERLFEHCGTTTVSECRSCVCLERGCCA